MKGIQVEVLEQHGPKALQEAINEWLVKNHKAEVEDIKVTGDLHNGLIATIVYRPEKDSIYEKRGVLTF